MRSVLRAIWAWMIRPPQWVLEAQAAIDAFADDNRRVIARMDAELEAFRKPPKTGQGSNAWM